MSADEDRALREEFEALCPAPKSIVWTDDGPEVRDDYENSYRAERYCGKWEGFKLARATQVQSAITYHIDDKGPKATESYAAMAACVDEATLKKLANLVAHGARATMGGGRIALTRKDWDAIMFLPLKPLPTLIGHSSDAHVCPWETNL